MKAIFLSCLLLNAFLFTACTQMQKGNSTNDTAAPPVEQQRDSNSALPASIAPNEIVITKKEYGEKWPFTKDQGTLLCKGANGVGEVTLTMDWKIYAVNGVAKGTKKYLPLEDVWASNPAIPGTRKNLGDVIDRGLSLCR